MQYGSEHGEKNTAGSTSSRSDAPELSGLDICVNSQKTNRSIASHSHADCARRRSRPCRRLEMGATITSPSLSVHGTPGPRKSVAPPRRTPVGTRLASSKLVSWPSILLISRESLWQARTAQHPRNFACSTIWLRVRTCFHARPMLDAVWGTDRFVTPRSVDVYVRRLREKIESDPENPRHLKTVRGAG